MLRSLRTWWARRFPTKPLGQRGEDFAARYLKRQGYHVVARNLDSRLGEIDIVAVDGRTVVFVEVKTRASTDAGRPAESVDQRRQQGMTQAALAYLKAHGLLDCSARFDVLAITWPKRARQPTIEHYKNAFSPVGSGQFFS